MKKYSILVPGGAGYIGSHIVKELLHAGHHVITLDNLSTGYRDMVTGGLFIKGSLENKSLLDDIFSEYQIDAVMHLAAVSLVGESVELPLKYYQNNVAGTVNLLNSMLRHNVKCFIFSSSAAVYGKPENIPITENHPCDPTNPYGRTKNFVEQILKDCDSAYNLRYVSLRYFNAAGADESGKIGERHTPETHLIPLILKTATGERENIRIFGTDYPTADGTCIRDYVHVSDLAQAHLLALNALLDGSRSAVYNLGNSRGYSVREVIELARKVTGRPVSVIEAERRPGDPPVLVANSDKIRKQLGWKPRYEDLETIIRTAWRIENRN
ncbi:UDP-glucose 4-epimerase GalE [Desulfonema magnum]|uniref:UDP-glucose 4-epimerase n=1 Tax=Desulfonema magnum TaxID=45655 RepID=A0A975GP52_9BACT|nr:UDP-glucose 4-epimerase GalE [Desulfonema magnum]QTA88661.1 UDP-glucose 4-epimerase [Desulfonema magnum]